MSVYAIPKDAIITVAGTVGVGKSTLTKELAKRLGFKTSLEEVVNNPYLEAFYQDFERWSFHLQIFLLSGTLQRAKIHLRIGRRICSRPFNL